MAHTRQPTPAKASLVLLAHADDGKFRWQRDHPDPGGPREREVRPGLWGQSHCPTRARARRSGSSTSTTTRPSRAISPPSRPSTACPSSTASNGHGTFTTLSQAGTGELATSGVRLGHERRDRPGRRMGPLPRPAGQHRPSTRWKSFSYTRLCSSGVQFLVRHARGDDGLGQLRRRRVLPARPPSVLFHDAHSGAIPIPVAIDFSTGDSGYPEFPATSPSVLAVGGTRRLHRQAPGAATGSRRPGGNILGRRGRRRRRQHPVRGAPPPSSSNGVGLHRAGRSRTSGGRRRAHGGLGLQLLRFPHPAPGPPSAAPASPRPSSPGSSTWPRRPGSIAGFLPLSSPQINARLYAAYADPSLYASYFHDIAVGNNTAVGGTTGFNAVAGYDRATGMRAARSATPWSRTWPPPEPGSGPGPLGQSTKAGRPQGRPAFRLWRRSEPTGKPRNGLPGFDGSYGIQKVVEGSQIPDFRFPIVAGKPVEIGNSGSGIAPGLSRFRIRGWRDRG